MNHRTCELNKTRGQLVTEQTHSHALSLSLITYSKAVCAYQLQSLQMLVGFRVQLEVGFQMRFVMAQIADEITG